MMEKDLESTLGKLTLQEKIALVSGHDFMFTNRIKRLGIRALRFSDGPHGLRVQTEGGDNGVTGSLPATAFPTAATVASSWNLDNPHKIGSALGKEAHEYGIDVVLGPGANIKRCPLAGRNFEYFSEDPLLSGKMAAQEIKGIEKEGVGVSLKHFALNNTEDYRSNGDSVCDERAMREIYLKSFEIAVKEGKPATIMSAYNKVNGTYCSENEWLLTDLLRNEWGFDGLVMTDWGAMHDRVKALKAGLDLEMPGDSSICRKWIEEAIGDGRLPASVLDKAVLNVLRLVAKYDREHAGDCSLLDDDKLAEEVAIDSAVLLKNDGILPLKRGDRYVVVGDLFAKMRYQGAGSSMINPTRLLTPEEAFKAAGVDFVYRRGYEEERTETDESLLKEAVEEAKKGGTLILFAGLTDYVEMESSDRKDMRLPKNQLDLINALLPVNPNLVVVLYGGSSVEMPFIAGARAILDMYLPGQAGGRATYSLLFGEESPSGHLAETWFKEYSSLPFSKSFGQTPVENYKESIYVGYRYGLAHREDVAFPFGYGLSYSRFAWSDFTLEENGKDLIFSLTVENCGEFNAADVVQIYVRKPVSGLDRPLRELKGFCKVYLKKSQQKKVEIRVSKEDLQVYDVSRHAFCLEEGEYLFEACLDAFTPRFSLSVKLSGEKIASSLAQGLEKKYRAVDIASITEEEYDEYVGYHPTLLPLKPITLESKLDDLKATFMGRILRAAVLSVAKKKLKAAKRLPPGIERSNKVKGAIFLRNVMVNTSLVSLSMNAGGAMPYNYAEGFVELSNGHLVKGIKCFARHIEALDLPEEAKHG